MPKQPLVEQEETTKVDVAGDHDLVKIIVLVLVVALIAVPLLLWWDDLSQTAQNLFSSDKASKPELSIPVPIDNLVEIGNSNSIPLPGDGAADGKNEPVSESQAEEKIKTTDDAATEQQQVDSIIKPLEQVETEIKLLALPQQPVMEEVKSEPEAIKESVPEPVVTAAVTKPTSAPKPAAVPEPAKAVKAANVEQGVWFNFMDSGWVKVRDAKNRVILIGEHKKGARKKLKSVMPYKVVLGNSKAVKVEIDGIVADIEKYSSGGVARFTINDGKIGKP
jgi:cytoskeleton protein RodZ